MVLSVVIPVYRSENSIRLLVEKLQAELTEITFEIVLVNDCSPDNAEKICIDLVEKFKNVKLISLRKNFGEFNAVMAGLNHCQGDYAVMVDDDFQNPPSEILKLLDAAQKHNFDVVYSQYTSKKHNFFRNSGSRCINFINNFLLEKPTDLYLSSFKLIHKEVVQEIIKYKGHKPYIDALIFRVTNNVGKVLVKHHERADGKSGYTFKKLVSLFVGVIFGYSQFPIRVFGLSFMILNSANFLIFNLQNIDNKIFMIILLMCLQFVFLIILGEYIGKILMEQSQKPQFVIKKIFINDDRK